MLPDCPATHPFNLYGDADEYPCDCHASTPVHSLETSGIGPDNLPQLFRHSGWQRQRLQVYEALRDAHASPSSRDAFAYCGATCYVLAKKSDPSNIKLAASCCHNRFCRPCANTRSRTIAANVAAKLGTHTARFLTFTLRHNDAPLKSQIDRLYSAFKRLRATVLWKRTQKGGVAFLEVKKSTRSGSWHPHLHVLSTGKYIDGQLLSHAWKNITRDSWIVDVRLIKSAAVAVSYVTKYASKPFDPSLFDDHETLVEAIKALRGTRMALSFGNWKGLQMTETPDKDAWDFLDTLEGLCERAAQGDEKAEKIVLAACGQRGKLLIERAGQKAVPRMNVGHPPIPDPQLYLLPDPHPSYGRYP